MRIFLLFITLFSTAAYAGQTIQNEHTRATIISNVTTAVAGQSFEIGVLLEPQEGWHTYWENPGDAGIPTSINWQLPDGITAGPLLWPTPQMIKEDTLTVFGYKNAHLLRSIVTIPADSTLKNFSIHAKASWLVCEHICVPEDAELSLEIPVGSGVKPSDVAEKFIESAQMNPEPRDPVPYQITKEYIEFKLPPVSLIDDKDIYFIPREQNLIRYSEPQIFSDGVLKIARNPEAELPEKITGLLMLPAGRAQDITLEKLASTTSHPPPKQTHFIILLFSAILGGLILNLMPCVLPILSLKALAIAKKAHHERKKVVKHSIAYCVGVLLSFGLIAMLLISLQQAGETIGWGYQMQSPPFVGFLIILLFFVGMNLLGSFELPVLFGSALSKSRGDSTKSSFFTGILAVMVATPCTAPFMATAVGAAISLPPVLALLIFLGIGFGMSLPFLLIALFPRCVTYLPKPGVWMETFKQFLAFPMFASVIWLLWVLTMQAGAQGLLVILVTLLCLQFMFWLKQRCSDISWFCRSAIILLLLAIMIQGLNALAHSTEASSGGQTSNSELAYSEQKLSELRAKNIPVFVDATAAWCITCQVNAKIALRTDVVRAAFDETDTVFMTADWTNRDEEISRFLNQFGYNGVPLYVYYPAQGEPQILPQILSESLVISTLKGTRP